MDNLSEIGRIIGFGTIGWIAGIIVNWLSDQLPFVGMQRQVDSEVVEGHDVSFRKNLGAPRCKHCGRKYQVTEWSGILGMVFTRQVCGQCNQKRSIRDILVEIVLILGVPYILLTRELNGTAIAITIYLVAFTLISVIDFEHRWVLNYVVLPLFAVVIVESLVSGRITPENWRNQLSGFAVAQIVMTAIYLLGELYLWNLNRRSKEPVTEVAFGSGDITLATLCGLILGTPNIVYGLIFTLALGLALVIIYAGSQVISGKGLKANMPIAYGPAILASCLAMLLWPDWVIALMYGTQ